MRRRDALEHGGATVLADAIAFLSPDGALEPRVELVPRTDSLAEAAREARTCRCGDDALAGALTVIRRSYSASRVNPHFHSLAFSGVYVRAAEGTLDFHPLPAPSGPGEGHLVRRGARLRAPHAPPEQDAERSRAPPTR